MDKNRCNIKINKDLNLDIFKNIKEDFPFFKNNIIYLDSSATTQKPKVVIDTINEYYNKYCSNISRGQYEISKYVKKSVDSVRKKVADFLNVSDEEIVFTSGATESSNCIAYSYALYNLKNDDEILLCNEDHKSSILPFINIVNILKKVNINVNFKEILIDSEGDYKEDDLISKVTDKTKIVLLTHIHNVYGLEMDIKSLVPRIKEKNFNCKIILDCSQSIGHIKVDLKELDVDFAYFSGHKMFASNAIGILYVKKCNYNLLYPYKLGGGSNVENLNIDSIEKKNTMLESGTQNLEGILSLGSAIDYINSIGINNIESYILYLTRYLYDELSKINAIEFDKGIDRCKCMIGYGIISFKINGYDSIEVGETLNNYNICVRTGDFCKGINKTDFIRISLHIYNSTSDIDKLIKVIKYIIYG